LSVAHSHWQIWLLPFPLCLGTRARVSHPACLTKSPPLPSTAYLFPFLSPTSPPKPCGYYPALTSLPRHRHHHHHHHQGPYAMLWASFPSFCLLLPCSRPHQPLHEVTVSRNSRIVCRFSSPPSIPFRSPDHLPFLFSTYPPTVFYLLHLRLHLMLISTRFFYPTLFFFWLW